MELVKGYIDCENLTKLLYTDIECQDSLDEIIKLKNKFKEHVNDEHYKIYGPLRECLTLYITENIKPKFANKNQIFETTKFVKDELPNTLKLYLSLITLLDKEDSLRARAYITILEPGKKIYKHSDTAVKYFGDINRYQFYYSGNNNAIQKISDSLFPVAPGYFYFFDHRQLHEYENNSDEDLILMVFDLYK